MKRFVIKFPFKNEGRFVVVKRMENRSILDAIKNIIKR